MNAIEPTRGSVSEQVARRRSAVERLVAWTGALPLALFLVLHSLSEARWARAADISSVVRQPLPSWESASLLAFVWLPLSVHVLLGIWLLSRGAQGESAREIQPAAPLGPLDRRASRGS